MIANQTHTAIWRRRKSKRRAWSKNAVAAKTRKRIERAKPEIPDDPPFNAPKLPLLKFATVLIRCGKESVSFRVHRWDEKRLLALGKVQASSTIGKRVAFVLEATL